MSINHSNHTLRLLGALTVLLLVLSGCKRSSLDAQNTKVLPGLSQPVRVSSGDTDAAEPGIAASPDGSVYVVWVNHGPKTDADVMIARFSGNGQMQGSPVRVNSQPGIATAWRGDPPTVAVAPDHTVYVGWTARAESESGHATDLYLSSSRDQGLTFSASVKVNDDTKPAVHGMHSLSIGNDGRIYIAWLDERNVAPIEMKDMKMEAGMKGHHMESNRELFFASSTDGGRTFTPNQRVATNVCPCCKTALAISSDGRLYVSWRQVLPGDLRHIAVSSSPDQGKTFTPPKIVSDDQWVLAGCPVSGSSLSIDKNGTLTVLWYSAGKNGETGLYLCQSKDSGATFGARRLVAAGITKGTPVLLVTNEGLAGIWEGNENGKLKVIATKLDSSPTPSDGLTVATNGELPVAAATPAGIVIAYIAKDQWQGVWVRFAWQT
jgi:hypothetical protein